MGEGRGVAGSLDHNFAGYRVDAGLSVFMKAPVIPHPTPKHTQTEHQSQFFPVLI